jgi:acetylornithine/N-succinyldiaminopimelate aminotransferase
VLPIEGLLVGWVLNSAIALNLVLDLFDRGLLVNAPRPNILRFMPTLTVAREEIDKMLSILGKELASKGRAAT